MQTEELAMNYSKALNNRALFYTYKTSQDGTQKNELLTYDNLTSLQNTNKYRLATPDGKLVCKSLEEANAKYRGDNDPLFTENDILVLPAVAANPEYMQDLIQSGELIIQQRSSRTTFKYSQTGEKEYQDQAQLRQAIKDKNPESPDSDIEKWLTNEMAAGSVTRYQWSNKALSGMTDVSSKLDDTDDAKASADYEYKSLVIQNQDKQLDVELKQVETQQKACDNEIDSVKKILDKNIERSFKTFA